MLFLKISILKVKSIFLIKKTSASPQKKNQKKKKTHKNNKKRGFVITALSTALDRADCICREEENLVFWFGAQFISTLNFTQSG